MRVSRKEQERGERQERQSIEGLIDLRRAEPVTQLVVNGFAETKGGNERLPHHTFSHHAGGKTECGPRPNLSATMARKRKMVGSAFE